MRSRRFACMLLGLWLGGGFFMSWIAAGNFRSVDRLLAKPDPVAAMQFRLLNSTGGIKANARMLLRYQVSEQNRAYFEQWEIVQIILGLCFFFFLLFGTRENKFLVAVTLVPLVITAIQRFGLTPEITGLGRVLDFVPAAMDTPDRSRFWVLHNAYVVSEVCKWAVEIGLGVWLVMTGRRRSDVRNELDMIDKANYRHINR